ncbi:hypothetical protein LLEC1_02827 [Akanthomyces lecanii]|uniref:Nickel/cobalt efflux system n=1 Tax=Cordyceps confragosa TaxID=2714763 RepID=A0A179I3J0_CORDF|nr:hypothetical protein LLEC1_02827 [Akanthomyces lecanii]
MAKLSMRLPPKPNFLRGIPNNSILAISCLVLVNAVVWAACAVVLAERRRDEADGRDGRMVTEYDAEATASGQFNLEGGGFMAKALGFLFKAIDRPWKMYPLGVVFGLGFDTSSEIAILGIASIQAVQGTSIWLILIFPILFTSGMCLLDTTDGALMMALYSSKAFSRDVVAILYYSIVLTGITVFVAAFIGIIQVLSLVQNVAEPEGSFWDGVSAIGDHFDIVGGSIVGVFVVVGLGSILVYRPWRRRMDRKRQGLAASADAGLRDAEVPETPFSQDEATPRHLMD